MTSCLQDQSHLEIGTEDRHYICRKCSSLNRKDVPLIEDRQPCKTIEDYYKTSSSGDETLLDYSGTDSSDDGTEDEDDDDSEYSRDILKTFLRLERRLRPARADSMALQTYFNCKAREKLVLWMIGVHQKYCSYQQTLHLAVNILDRFCSVWVFRHNYQLYGVVALWIASKYQEKSSNSVLSQWVRTAVVNRFGTSTLNWTEELILKSIDFVLGIPTCVDFYHLFARRRNNSFEKNAIIDHLAEYFMDLTLVSENNSLYSKLQSEIASICLCLAEQILLCNTSISAPPRCRAINSIQTSTLMLINQAVNPPEVIRRKYSNSKYGDPSIMAAIWLRSQQKLLFTLDLFLRRPRASSSQKQPDDAVPLSPPRTPYLTRVMPSLSRKIP